MSASSVLSRFGYVLIQRQNVLFKHLPYCMKYKYFSNKPLEPTIVEGLPASALPQKKTKRPIVPRITLISGNNDITITTLEDAQKLATRRNLKLVKIVDFDTKTERPVYKLMTAAQYAAEDIKQKKEKKSGSPYKGEKVLMLSSVITDHDLQTQIKKIEKWIGKEYEVRVAISGSIDQSVNKILLFYQFSILI